MIFKPTVKTVVVNSDFSWLGRFLLPGIFDGRHLFKITPTENGCLLVQKEEFSGLLVPFLGQFRSRYACRIRINEFCFKAKG